MIAMIPTTPTLTMSAAAWIGACCWLAIGSSASLVGWHKVNSAQLDMARAIGAQARRQYLSSLADVRLTKVEKQQLYDEGLEKCAKIDDEAARRLYNDMTRKHRQNDAELLQQTGLSRFLSMLYTLPAARIKYVVDVICARHEKQIECGAEFEGKRAIGMRLSQARGDDSSQSGSSSYRQMFEHECVHPTYAEKTYSCIGNVRKWMSEKCMRKVNEYWRTRQESNMKIRKAYDKAIRKLQNEIEDSYIVLDETMTRIRQFESFKCSSFKQMRVCLIENLVKFCGNESASAFNSSISDGYLTRERGNQLETDFQYFHYPPHPDCTHL